MNVYVGMQRTTYWKGFARFAPRVLVVDVPHTCIFLTDKDIASAVQCF